MEGAMDRFAEVTPQGVQSIDRREKPLTEVHSPGEQLRAFKKAERHAVIEALTEFALMLQGRMSAHQDNPHQAMREIECRDIINLIGKKVAELKRKEGL